MKVFNKNNLVVAILAFLFSPTFLHAQLACEPYGKKIFNLIVTGDTQLKNEFIDLIEYQSYVDRLSMPIDKKEELKQHAMQSYLDLKKDFYKESDRIIAFYQDIEKNTQLTYQFCNHTANPKYPGIGFIELYYLAEKDGEITDDSISFECIYTSDGWRIIDGFYQVNPK